MKTPEEIKTGLEYCSQNVPYPCNGCPYERDELLENAWRCNLNADALAYIQQLEAQIPKWISVEERLPNKQCEFLVLYSFGETNVHYFSGVMYFVLYDERPHFENDGLYGLHVTHWMPLPELPKKE